MVHLCRHESGLSPTVWVVWASGRCCQGRCHHLGVVMFHLSELRGKLGKKSLGKSVRQRLVSTSRWAVRARSWGLAGDKSTLK